MRPGTLAIFAGLVAYLSLVLQAEAIWLVLSLLGVGLIGLVVIVSTGWLDRGAAASATAGTAIDKRGLALLLLGTVVLVVACHDNHFALLVLCSMLSLALAGYGLALQSAALGLPNLAGAASLGLGGYTAALATTHLGLPHLLALALAGGVVALVAALLLTPLRRGYAVHAVVVTLAATLLFERGMAALAVTGGTGGLALPPLTLFGWRASFGFAVAGYEVSQYAIHALLALAALVGILALTQPTHGGQVRRIALGGLALGLSGALNALQLGFVGPQFYGVGESLVLAGIVAIGGAASRWGVVLAAAALALLLGKLQLLQELRVAIVAVVVLILLWRRPGGMLGRAAGDRVETAALGPANADA